MCHHKHLIHDVIYAIIKGNSYSYFFKYRIEFFSFKINVLFFRIGKTDFTGYHMIWRQMIWHNMCFSWYGSLLNFPLMIFCCRCYYYLSTPLLAWNKISRSETLNSNECHRIISCVFNIFFFNIFDILHSELSHLQSKETGKP